MTVAGLAPAGQSPVRVRCTVLGCGTSIGVPVVGCNCDICTSDDPRNRRLRVSIYVELWSHRAAPGSPAHLCVLVDTSPDLRQQLLRLRTLAVDEVFYTHTHADHIFGLDDLRPVHFAHKPRILVRGRADHLAVVQSIFPYAFRDTQDALGPVPQLEAHPLLPGSFETAGLHLQAVELAHGPRETVLGYRFGPLAYLTDVSDIPAQAVQVLHGVDTVIIGALRARPHTKHFSVQQAVEAAQALEARRVILTHMGHEIDYSSLLSQLDSMELGGLRAEPAYDGLVVDLQVPHG